MADRRPPLPIRARASLARALLAASCAVGVLLAPAPALEAQASPQAQHPTTGRVEADGAGLHYRIVGSGDDTVVVPLGSIVGPALEPLARNRTLVLYDMRGRGRSDPIADPERLGFDADVEDLEAIRRHLGAGRISVVGYSYLGAVAAHWALRYPERVDRLALVAPLAPRAPHPDAFGAEELTALLGPERLALLQPPYGADPATPASCRAWWEAMVPLYVGSATDTGAFLADVELGCDLPNERPDAFLPTLTAVLGDLGTYDWRADAGALRRPVLVVHGTDDRAAPPAGGAEWARAVADGHLETVGGAGHFVLFERTAEVVRLLDAFLPGGG